MFYFFRYLVELTNKIQIENIICKKNNILDVVLFVFENLYF